MFRTTLSLAALMFTAGMTTAAAAPAIDTNVAETVTENAQKADHHGKRHAKSGSKSSSSNKKARKGQNQRKRHSAVRASEAKRRAAAQRAAAQRAAANRAAAKRAAAKRAQARWRWNHSPRWTYGVFVHPHRHRGVHPARTFVPVPERSVDRSGTLSLGIRGGTYLGAYEAAGVGEDIGFGDFGLGVAARARLAEPVGLEVSWGYHDQSFQDGSTRITEPLSASVQFFAVPWATVSPYALAGVTWTNRNYSDTYFDGVSQLSVDVEDQLFGPHIGLGVELNVSDSTSINFEAKSIGYLNVDAQDPSVPASLQGTMGLNLHF